MLQAGLLDKLQARASMRSFMSAPCLRQGCTDCLNILFGMLQAGLLDKLQARASTRQLSDLTIGPVLTWTTQAMLDHMNKLLQLPGEHGA
jgi:hypothetical protein